MLDNNKNNSEIIFNAYTKEYEKSNEILANLYLDKLRNDINLTKKVFEESLNELINKDKNDDF